MERIIPPETYQFIEGKLHSRDIIQQKIEEWRLSVTYPENKQYVRGKGYISDPTANQAIKFADLPEHIREYEKWIELIDKTRDFCHKRGNRIFEIWYPVASEKWNWTKKTIDYNAQQFARTMVSHAYQQSLVQMVKHNPFVEYIRWRSADIAKRTCALCKTRNGQLFMKEALPFDHPNGLCTFIPEIGSMDDVAERLADWANGKEDAELDKFYENAYQGDTEKISPKVLKKPDKSGIIDTGSGKMDGILPNADKAIIAIEKFTKYALDPMKDPNKALAFEKALGYNKDNANQLITNIYKNLPLFKAAKKGDKGFGMQYEVVLNLLGINNKYANVLTGWIVDNETKETRLTTAYVTKKKVLE